MLVIRMLGRITQSSEMHRIESVSVMDHEQTMGVSSRVLDQKQQNIFGRISLFWSVELQQDMAKDVLLFQVQHSATHFYCLFVIHH